MSDPEPEASDPGVEDPLNQSSTGGHSSTFQPDTSAYFEAWLKDLKPAPDANNNPLRPAPVSVIDDAPGTEFYFEGTLRIEGFAAGRFRSLTGTLIVSENSEIQSDILVAIAIIDGRLCGDIRASERVELLSHARVIGNIESPAIAIQTGAIFEGQCHFLTSDELDPSSRDNPEPSLVEPS